MKTYLRVILFFFFGIVSLCSLKAQGSLCLDIEPFCAGEQRLTFPNSNYTNSPQLGGELGPDYGCLEEQPYPAWFFLQVEDSGNLTFEISQFQNEDGTGAGLDVDFVVWGPFSKDEDFCSGRSLSATNIVDCSFLPDDIETMTIPGAQADEIYVVVITNFQQLPGYISLEQINSGQGGSTDCSILSSNLGDSISVCGENEYILDGSTDEAEIYEWYVLNNNTGEYERIPGADNPEYTVTVSGDYRLVVKNATGDSSDQDDVRVDFYDLPLIGNAEELAVCERDQEFINLNETEASFLEPNNGPDEYTVLYFPARADAENGEEIERPDVYRYQGEESLFARVRNENTGCLSEIKEFEIVFLEFPEIILPESTIICVDFDGNLVNPVGVGEDLGNEFSYRWSSGGEILSNEAILDLNIVPSGDNLNLTITHNQSGCESNFQTSLAKISRPESISIEISGSDFGDGYTVEATPENTIGEEFAEFEYRLDSGNWQAGNTFNKVAPGSHVITAREINGCGETTSESFFLVGYPRFFSPNLDGYNDTWSLITDTNITIKKLFIFDRYGKLLKEINPNQGKGWDGTLNGQPLPADDYWFRVEFVDEKTGDQREYMSNFSLIR